jgi:hypothetical protein
VVLVEEGQDALVKGFNGAGDKETASFFEGWQMPGMFEQVLYLDGHIVS